MCSRRNLQLLFQFSLFLKFVLFCTLMTIGGLFVADKDLERAYGSTIVSHGAGLLMVGGAVPLSQYLGARGSLQHNTFLLLMHTFVETTLFSIQYGIASDVMAISADEYAPALREECLRWQPDDAEACVSYLASDRYAGLHLVWAANYDLAQDASDYYSKLEEWQNAGDCCGFAAPLSCALDERPPPSDRLLDGVSATLQRYRQTCGQKDLWYATSGRNSYTCSQAVNPDAAELVVGGCKYEMPLGGCKDYDPEAGTKGCASILEATMNQSLNIQGAIVFLFTLFQVLSVVASCCLCWKRKAFDVIPHHLEAAPIDPYKPPKKKKVGLGEDNRPPEPAPVTIGSEVESFRFTAQERKDDEAHL